MSLNLDVPANLWHSLICLSMLRGVHTSTDLTESHMCINGFYLLGIVAIFKMTSEVYTMIGD